MRVDYQFSNGSRSYLHYKQFRIESSSAKYQLVVGGFTRVGKDEFDYHNKMYFSTPDCDNDKHSSGSCAALEKSGWWFNYCDDINLNERRIHVMGSSIFSEMKIRPKDCIIQ